MAARTKLTPLALSALLLGSCNERSQPGGPAATAAPSGVAPATAAPSGVAPATAAPSSAEPEDAPKPQQADIWLRVSKGGYELGVVELLVGKPWRFVSNSGSDDARALAKLIDEHGAKPIALSMHLPAKKEGERGPYGSSAVAPGDSLYKFAVEELLSRNGFDVRGPVPRYEDKNPPASVKKLELSRDGAKVGTLDFTGPEPKLTLVNREGNALFLESFWKAIEREDQLIVSHLPPEGGKDALVTVSAKKGSKEYPKVVRLAFAVRYPAYTMVVSP